MTLEPYPPYKIVYFSESKILALKRHITFLYQEKEIPIHMLLNYQKEKGGLVIYSM